MARRTRSLATTAPPDTRARIVAAALDLANEAGSEAVTTRSVAAAIGVSPGNVSYHFPRRDDLLLGLAEALSARNDDVWSTPPPSCVEMLEQYRTALRNQWRHRGIVVALPELLHRHPGLREHYARTEVERYRRQRAGLVALSRTGELDLDEDGVERVLAQLVLVARWAWLDEYRVTFADRTPEAAIAHYVAVLASVLAPHASPAARRALRPLLAERFTLPR